MKAGYIVTEHPELFRKEIQLATSLGWVLNAGKFSDIKKEKYIFIKYNEDTDFYNISKKILDNKLDGYSDENTVVNLNINNVILEERYNELPIPENQEILEDTALVIVGFFYGEDSRHEALQKGIEQLRRLNPMPKIVFYEANTEPTLNHLFENDIYKFIKLEEKNSMIWQKEALFNLAINDTDFEYYITHDGDSFPDKADWALCVRNILSLNKMSIVQCGYYHEDTIYKNRSHDLYAYKKMNSNSNNFFANPGLSTALSKETFSIIEGFNPFFIAGSGDGANCTRLDKTPGYKNGFEDQCPWWMLEVNRTRKNMADYLFAPYRITHISHGDFKNRGYYWRNKCLQWAGIKDIKKHVKLGDNGLVEWIGEQNVLKYILANKHRLQDEFKSLEVLREAYVRL